MDIRRHGCGFPDQPINLLVHKREGLLVLLCINILALTCVIVEARNQMKQITLKRWIGFTIVRTEIRKGTCKHSHGMCIVTVHLRMRISRPKCSLKKRTGTIGKTLQPPSA